MSSVSKRKFHIHPDQKASKKADWFKFVSVPKQEGEKAFKDIGVCGGHASLPVGTDAYLTAWEIRQHIKKHDSGEVVPGSWVPLKERCQFCSKLEHIAQEEHFRYLHDTYPGTFKGSAVMHQKFHGKTDSIEEVRDEFLCVMMNTANALVNGLNQKEMHALVEEEIRRLSKERVGDYDKVNNKLIVIAENYDGAEADAIGVLNIKYHLIVNDFKNRGHMEHEYLLEVWSWASLYFAGGMDLERDYDIVAMHFGE